MMVSALLWKISGSFITTTRQPTKPNALCESYLSMHLAT